MEHTCVFNRRVNEPVMKPGITCFSPGNTAVKPLYGYKGQEKDACQDSRQEYLACIREKGIYILDPLRAPADASSRNLILTLEQLEAWRRGEPER